MIRFGCRFLTKLDRGAEGVGLGACGLVLDDLAVVSFGLIATTLSVKSSSATSFRAVAIAFSMSSASWAIETVSASSGFMGCGLPGFGSDGAVSPLGSAHPGPGRRPGDWRPAAPIGDGHAPNSSSARSICGAISCHEGQCR